MALAVSNKFIHLLQVLPERAVHRRGVHRGGAGKLHVSKIYFLIIQNFGSLRKGNLRGGPSANPIGFQGGIRWLPQLQKSSSDDQQALLVHYEFHVLTLHDPSLRGSRRWTPAPSDFSQIVSAQFPDVPP